MRIPYDTLFGTLRTVLRDTGFAEDRAERCARLFADASRDGVPSHGLNRFPHFLEMIRAGFVDIHAVPERVDSFGTIEQWDGRLGPGNLNAYAMMNRAIELTREHGTGCVGLRNTNHWMRGGAYGWQAAEAGMAAMCWTNTIPIMPPWGAKESRLGNNPLVMAVPRPEGHIVLDMAMSLYSYGKLGTYRRAGQKLPFPGGFDREGNLTDDPGEILETQRALPVGYWKGAGLSFMLDALATLLSAGDSVKRLGEREHEYGVSQVFIAFDLEKLYPDPKVAHRVLDDMVADLCAAEPATGDDHVYYPGRQTLTRRKDNLTHGVPVDAEIWEEVRKMA